MNYIKIYDKLIDKAKNRVLYDVYYESHHIIPKCMGGKDTKDNIVKLLAREHFLAHALLFKHYKTTKLAYAWMCMFRVDQNQKRKFSSREYEKVRKILSGRQSLEMKGKNNYFYGRSHSEDTKNKLRDIMKNKNIKISPETMKKIIEKASRPKSEDHKRKIGRKGFIMLKNIDTNISIRILKEDSYKYDKKIWMNPYKIKRIRMKLDEN
jgi:hypothetical protein